MDGAEEEERIKYEQKPFSAFIRFGHGRGGMWFRYKGQGLNKAPNIKAELPLTLGEAFNGKKANVTVTRKRLCTTCQATGSSHPENMTTCELCAGKGYAYHIYSNDEDGREEKSGEFGNSCSDSIYTGGNFSEEAETTGTPMPGYAHVVNMTCKV
ncbi:unnamed protein product, partial [Choristocarpus tenellus]